MLREAIQSKHREERLFAVYLWGSFGTKIIEIPWFPKSQAFSEEDDVVLCQMPLKSPGIWHQLHSHLRLIPEFHDILQAAVWLQRSKLLSTQTRSLKKYFQIYRLTLGLKLNNRPSRQDAQVVSKEAILRLSAGYRYNETRNPLIQGIALGWTAKNSRMVWKLNRSHEFFLCIFFKLARCGYILRVTSQASLNRSHCVMFL